MAKLTLNGIKTPGAHSIGAHLRYTRDRDSKAYKGTYRQRTASQRINSQTVALGIARPHLCNSQAIANRNTPIYTPINRRFLWRIHARLATNDIGSSASITKLPAPVSG